MQSIHFHTRFSSWFEVRFCTIEIFGLVVLIKQSLTRRGLGSPGLLAYIGV